MSAKTVEKILITIENTWDKTQEQIGLMNTRNLKQYFSPCALLNSAKPSRHSHSTQTPPRYQSTSKPPPSLPLSLALSLSQCLVLQRVEGSLSAHRGSFYPTLLKTRQGCSSSVPDAPVFEVHLLFQGFWRHGRLFLQCAYFSIDRILCTDKYTSLLLLGTAGTSEQ